MTYRLFNLTDDKKCLLFQAGIAKCQKNEIMRSVLNTVIENTNIQILIALKENKILARLQANTSNSLITKYFFSFMTKRKKFFLIFSLI